jgi:CRP-like cAMP-binding protein
MLAVPGTGQPRVVDDPGTWANVLETVPLFAGLGRRHVGKIARAGRIARFHHGTEIVRAGEAGETFYVVLDGDVTVKRPRGRGATVGLGGFFGELSLLDGGPRSATVVAHGDVVCFVLRRTAFAKVLRAEPAIAIAIMTELAGRLRRTEATP